MIATRKRLITAEQYLRMPDDGRHTELVRGRIEVTNLPTPRHGWHCAKAVEILIEYRLKHKSGRILCNDTGIVTERDPDTVRGADVAFYSFKRLARGKLPEGYLAAAADAVFEVRSPSDRMGKLLARIAEFLAAGVTVVCAIDPKSETISVYENDLPPRVLRRGDTLDLSKTLPGFRVPVARFFDED